MKWKRKRDPLDRLMEKVEQRGDCWEYVGSRRNGYGAPCARRRSGGHA